MSNVFMCMECNENCHGKMEEFTVCNACREGWLAEIERLRDLALWTTESFVQSKRIAELEGRIELLTAANEAILSESTEEIERLRAAADDYKALEDMREKFMPEQIEVAFSHIGFGHRWAYEVGDYQKTLAVLERGEVTKCNDCVEALREDEGDD